MLACAVHVCARTNLPQLRNVGISSSAMDFSSVSRPPHLTGGLLREVGAGVCSSLWGGKRMGVLRAMTPWNMAGCVECIGWAVVTQVREQESLEGKEDRVGRSRNGC